MNDVERTQVTDTQEEAAPENQVTDAEEKSVESSASTVAAEPETTSPTASEPAPPAPEETPSPVPGPQTMDQVMDQMAMMEEHEARPRSGQILDGVIVSVTHDEILVDVGAKTEGVISGRELERLPAEARRNLKVGESLVVYVLRPEDRDGHILLSLSRAQQERDWRRAEELLASQEIFEVNVTGHNRGGLVARLGRVRGFIPASQLANVFRAASEAAEEAPADVVADVEDIEADSESDAAAPAGEGQQEQDPPWAQLVGQKIWVKVIEIDRGRNRLILSERRALPERRREQKERLLSELRKGDVRQGVVTSLQDFGAFVDLGGADGLIHLSELSWSRVNHPGDVLHVGQQVQVYVLNVDRNKQRIGLSLRRLQPEPWSVVAEKFKVGEVVEGTITKLMNFGAFALVADGIEGLIHISELAKHRVGHPREVVQEGQTLQLRVIQIDPDRRRMGLSLRRVADEDYAEYDWQVEEGAESDESEDSEGDEAEA